MTRAQSGPQTREELLVRAAAYAETVDIDIDTDTIEWTISERAKRRAGSCRYDGANGQVTIVLTWDAYRAVGWEQFTGTIRHELVHAWEFTHYGESGHGPRFRRKADELDAPRHCESFTDGRLRLACTDEDCSWMTERHRASEPVKYPDRGYRCGDCESPYVVEHVDSGLTWRTNSGYERVRDKLGEDW
ncbi:SprT-like domain-containing protein [Halapricum hydrolyticum]|uniref:SprT-like domain-containing protein n=1 Tax=Halapricum hydrolyticum TaxID=2979991 RepID=A0AAE3ID41_9EURY|nr:SprT-like domain-containing protein [Halapricum hydrolyticum]MCU4718896.1 SprT-like domain-containing protein [Halapricum hydrolyticum]MCU4727826.1 SprT-like domain-containing protein [Halapricum hydrolyticum]